jgi:hypothetical protein
MMRLPNTFKLFCLNVTIFINSIHNFTTAYAVSKDKLLFNE